ncbi:monooxygenase [Nocardioides hungaricus]
MSEVNAGEQPAPESTPCLLQVDFPSEGPFGAESAVLHSGLAHSISDEPGFLWKIWTESPETSEGGGIYLFSSREDAQRYLEMHTRRLIGLGFRDIRGRIFSVNMPLTEINNGPVVTESHERD